MTTLVGCFVDRNPEIDLARLALRRDRNRLFIIERQTEFASQNICGAARNDREARISSSQTLNSFVDGAVTAGDDHIEAAVARDAFGNLCRLAGTRGQLQINFDTERL